MTSQYLKVRLSQHRSRWIGRFSRCEISLLHRVRSREEALKLEIEEIHKYRSLNPKSGYNKKTDKYVQDSKDLMSQSAKERVRKYGVPFLGQRHSNKTRKVMSNLKKGKTPSCSGHNSIKVKNLQTGEEFETILQACEKYNLHKASLSRHLRGKQKSCGGFQWSKI